MELLLLLGLVAMVALVAMGAVYWMKERRAGTIVAVSIPLRSVPAVREDRGFNSH